jgi:hypothetical protein
LIIQIEELFKSLNQNLEKEESELSILMQANVARIMLDYKKHSLVLYFEKPYGKEDFVDHSDSN